MANNEHEPEKPQVSEVDKDLLTFLEWIARTLQQQTATSDKNKSFWTAFKEPSVVAALITVLIGSLAATAITGIIQYWTGVREYDQSVRLREKDNELANIKAKADLKLAQYKEYSDQERALISRIYTVTGHCISASDSLVGLTEPAWRKRRSNDPQAVGIVQNYNQVLIKWNSEGSELGQLIDFYHPSEPEVMAAWNKLQEEVTAYLTCAHTLYNETRPPNRGPTDQARAECEKKRGDITTGLNLLASSRRGGLAAPW